MHFSSNLAAAALQQLLNCCSFENRALQQLLNCCSLENRPKFEQALCRHCRQFDVGFLRYKVCNFLFVYVFFFIIVLREFMEALALAGPVWVKFPIGANLEGVVAGFEAIAGLPNCCGAIDGTKIKCNGWTS
jgi:hypothetical protein